MLIKLKAVITLLISPMLISQSIAQQTTIKAIQNAQLDSPYCYFPQGDQIEVSSNNAFSMRPQILSAGTDLQYRWKCRRSTPISSSFQTCEEDDYPGIDYTQTSFMLQESQLTPGETKEYQLLLQLQGTTSETTFVGACEITLTVIDGSANSIVDMQIKSDASLTGWIDYDVKQNFECIPRDPSSDTDDFEYQLQIKAISTSSSGNPVNEFYLTRSEQGLQITNHENGGLQMNQVYMIECNVSGGFRDGKPITGKVIEYVHTKTYSLASWVSFSVSPASGIIYTTPFKITSTSLDSSQTMVTCKTGVVNQYGFLQITEQIEESVIFMARNDFGSTSRQSIQVMIDCQDPYGRHGYQSVSVELNKNTMAPVSLGDMAYRNPQSLYESICMFDQLSNAKQETPEHFITEVLTIIVKYIDDNNADIIDDPFQITQALQMLEMIPVNYETYLRNDLLLLRMTLRAVSFLAKGNVSSPQEDGQQVVLPIKLSDFDKIVYLASNLTNIVATVEETTSQEKPWDDAGDLVKIMNDYSTGRVMGNLLTTSTSKKNFSLDMFNLNIQKSSRRLMEFASIASYDSKLDEPISLADIDSDRRNDRQEQQVEISLPNSQQIQDTINQYQSWIFVSGVQNKLLSSHNLPQTAPKYGEVTFMSNTVLFQMKGSHDYLVTDQDQYVYENIEISNLEEPLMLTIPLKDGYDELYSSIQMKCLQIDTESETPSWDETKCDPTKYGVEWDKAENKFINCCTKNLGKATQFSVAITKPLVNSFSLIFTIIILIFVVLGIIGQILDRKRKLIYKYVESTGNVQQRKPKKPKNKKIEESQGEQSDSTVKYDRADIESPMKGQNSATSINAGFGRELQADVDQANNKVEEELKEDNIEVASSENKKDNAQLQIESPSSKEIENIDKNVKQNKSKAIVKKEKKQKQEKFKIDDYVYDDDEVVKRSCLGHWWTALRFYNRILMIIFSFDRKYYRSLKSLNSLTQLTFGICLACVLNNKMSPGGITLLVFIIMRPIQIISYLLAYHLVKRHDSAKLVFVVMLLVLVISCVVLIYDSVARDLSNGDQVYVILFLELFFWDSLLQPCFLLMLIYLPGEGNKIGALRSKFFGMKVTTLEVFEEPKKPDDKQEVKHDRD